MALSTSLTQVTRAGLSSFQNYEINAVTSVGVATFSNFKTGSTNVHSVGVEAAGINVLGGDTPIGAGATIYDDGGARFSGVVTATSFHGDISQATGAAAGLGTALSQTQTDPLNKIYYTNKVLSISTTTTIDHPATANLAYTQYGDIKIEDGHDLIIKDGDDFKYDILGISTTKLADNNFPNGLTGDLTGDVTGNVNNSTLLLKTGGNERLRITSTGDVGLGCIPDSNVRLHIEKAGEANMILEGDVNGIGGYLMLKNNNTTANASMAIQFLDGGGQGTSEIKGINSNNLNNEGHLAFSTRPSGGSMTERMRITKEGYITNPSRPYFKANMSSGTRITGTGYVVFDEAVHNNGSHYNTSDGKFTAPVTGLYWFSSRINAYDRIDFTITVNGTEVERGQYNTDSDDVGWWSNQLTTITYMTAGQYAQVNVTNLNQNTDPDKWVTFMGYLIG